MKPRAIAGIPVILLVILLFRTVATYRTTISVRSHVKTLQYESYFVDGLVPAVRWVQEHNCRRVYGARYEEDRYLYQRLLEMLYPIPFTDDTDDSIKAGDVVVLPIGREMGRAHVELFREGEIRIVRVEEPGLTHCRPAEPVPTHAALALHRSGSDVLEICRFRSRE